MSSRTRAPCPSTFALSVTSDLDRLNSSKRTPGRKLPGVFLCLGGKRPTLAPGITFPGRGARSRLTVFALFSVLLATTPAIRQAYAGRRSASEEYRSLATALDEQLGTGLVY